MSPRRDGDGAEPDAQAERDDERDAARAAEQQRPRRRGGERAAATAGRARRRGRRGRGSSTSDAIGAGGDRRGRRDDGRASGWIAEREEPRPSTSRGPGRVTTMSSIGRIAPCLDGGHAGPAGPGLRDRAAVDAVGRVAEEDQLGIGGDQLLDRISKFVALPVVTASPPASVDHLARRTNRRRSVDRPGRSSLVEDPRLRAGRRSRRATCVEPACIEVGRAPSPRPSGRSPSPIARCRAARRRRPGRRGRATGMLERAELGDRVGRR